MTWPRREPDDLLTWGTAPCWPPAGPPARARDLSRAHRASAALRAGTVWVNCFFVRDLRAPFGGVGDSGIGREGGTFSREFFTEPKAVVMQV